MDSKLVVAIASAISVPVSILLVLLVVVLGSDDPPPVDNTLEQKQNAIIVSLHEEVQRLNRRIEDLENEPEQQAAPKPQYNFRPDNYK